MAHDPLRISVTGRLQPPSNANLIGTDHLGRDLFSRVVYGSRLSLLVGVVVVLISTTGGIVLGLVGGYTKTLGNVVMRLVDGMMAFPGIVLALALVAALGSSLTNVIVALAIVYVPRVARVVHAAVLSQKSLDYVTAAEGLGANASRVMFRHLLPNSIPPVIIQSTFIFAYAIIGEASLSFLGVGVPPGTPTWGAILNEGRAYMQQAPWIVLFPGGAIFVVVLGLNLLGDGLRDLLDPRLRGVE